jgi:hypothetical protein
LFWQRSIGLYPHGSFPLSKGKPKRIQFLSLRFEIIQGKKRDSHASARGGWLRMTGITLFHHLVLQRHGNRLRPGGDLQLGEDIAYMELDRTLADHQFIRYKVVGEAVHH